MTARRAEIAPIASRSTAAIDAASTTPSRDGPSADGMVSIRGRADLINRFKDLARKWRFTQPELLELALDALEREWAAEDARRPLRRDGPGQGSGV